MSNARVRMAKSRGRRARNWRSGRLIDAEEARLGAAQRVLEISGIIDHLADQHLDDDDGVEPAP